MIANACLCVVQVAELELAERVTVLRQMSMGATAVLSPMAAIFGGIVGQEVTAPTLNTTLTTTITTTTTTTITTTTHNARTCTHARTPRLPPQLRFL